jgi:hypothetical protein
VTLDVYDLSDVTSSRAADRDPGGALLAGWDALTERCELPGLFRSALSRQ